MQRHGSIISSKSQKLNVKQSAELRSSVVSRISNNKLSNKNDQSNPDIREFKKEASKSRLNHVPMMSHNTLSPRGRMNSRQRDKTPMMYDLKTVHSPNRSPSTENFRSMDREDYHYGSTRTTDQKFVSAAGMHLINSNSSRTIQEAHMNSTTFNNTTSLSMYSGGQQISVNNRSKAQGQ